MPRKCKILSAIKVRVYPIVSDAVRGAITYGWNRVWKHREMPAGMPEDEAVIDEIHNSVMNDLSELLDWGD